MKNTGENLGKQKRARVKTLHAQFKKYGRNAQDWKRKCILMLPHIARERVWEAKGFSSIHEYGAKLAGLSRSAVEDALRLMRKVEGKKKIMKVVERKGVNAIRPIVSLVNEENEKFWAEKAMEMSNGTLRQYVREMKRENFRDIPKNTSDIPQEKAKSFSKNESQKFQALLKNENIEKLEKLKGERSWDDFFEDLLKLKEAQIKEEKQQISAERTKLEAEKPEPVRAKSRYIPAPISKFITARAALQTWEKILDGARIASGFNVGKDIFCEFPNCCKSYDEQHHSKRVAQHHQHDPDQIYCLCKNHHNLMHHGLIAHEELGPQYWRVREEADTNSYEHLVDIEVKNHWRQALLL
jgi:hypothetical protein